MEVHRQQGSFLLSDKVAIVVDVNTSDLADVAQLLQDKLKTDVGLQLAIDEASLDSSADNAIHLAIAKQCQDFGQEGYELNIMPESVVIRGAAHTGVVWGVQSLLQIIAFQSSPEKNEPFNLPALRIVDRPRFGWRGLLLDCSRTFLTIDYLKKYADICAFYKMNKLQLHLTDDQGWRLEIRKHPKLTEIGSKFDPRFPGEISGYYSQEEIRDLVQYAARRGVTIVPEIEMPGHCLSLLAVYPELSCAGGKDKYVIAPFLFMSDGDPTKEPKTPGGVVCAGNEKTFEVIEDILDEVIEMFPSEYIHIAGDECSKGYWKSCPKCQARIKAEGLANEDELQSYFIKRVAKMIQDKGRKVFGWDEILEGGLAPNVSVMGWRGMGYVIPAIKQGHDVVMMQKSHLYFDYCYNRAPASLVYAFDPFPPGLTPAQRSLVIGVECCMWTHLARSEDAIDRSIFPRMLALAEVGWTPVERKQWDNFSARMDRHVPILEAKGVACFKRNEGVTLPNISAGQDGKLWLVNEKNEIYVRQGDAWDRFPGKARQVTSGPDGRFWAVSTQPTRRGYVLMRWSDGKWQPIGEDVAAVQISAAPDGSLWTVTEAYAIWKYANEKWSNVIGLARAVSAGFDDTVWSLSTDPAPGGYQLHYLHTKSRWRRHDSLMAGDKITAGTPGQLWLITDTGKLRQFVDGNWHNRPGQLSQLTVTKDGTPWALADDGKTVQILKWTGQAWQNAGQVP